MCCKCYHIIFSTFSLKFKCKICVQKEVIHNFKKSHFGHVTSYELTHFKKMVQAWKTKSLLFCLRYDPLIVFPNAKSCNFHFHKNDVTWPLSAYGLVAGQTGDHPYKPRTVISQQNTKTPINQKRFIPVEHEPNTTTTYSMQLSIQT